ncbi:MAG: hypothetical protein ACLGHY_03300 [Gammaproteobacteria bacterium]
MATVNFSVPEAIKDSFNAAFKGSNKSAIIAELMREAVERAERRQRKIDAIDRIVERRKAAPALSEEEFRTVRETGRP